MHITNIPRTYEEMRDWADAYELRAMIPSETTHQLAEVTTALLLHHVPSFLKGFLKRVIIALMNDRLRTAMVYEPQPRWIHALIEWGFYLRAVYLRNFALPRIWRKTLTNEEKNQWGRYSINYSDNAVSSLNPLYPSPLNFLSTLCFEWEADYSRGICHRIKWACWRDS